MKSETPLEARPAVLAGVLGLTVLLRLAPHVWTIDGYPWNFSPIVPACLFGAAFVRSRGLAFAAPIGCWLAGDLVLGLLHRDAGWMLYPGQLFTYGAIALCVALGFLLRRHLSVASVVGLGLATAVLFFALTNFGTWLASGLYPRTAAGLAECFAAGIPFFRYTLLSQIVFLPVLFSPLALRPQVHAAASAGLAA